MYRIAWSAKLKKKIKINTPTEKKTMILDLKKKKKAIDKGSLHPKILMDLPAIISRPPIKSFL